MSRVNGHVRIAGHDHPTPSDRNPHLEGRTLTPVHFVPDNERMGEVREELRMIFGEALLNAFRHAGAARMTLSLRYGWWGLRVTLDDDGRGIAPEVLVDGRPGHLGLAAMRERATGLGARWSVTSQMGKGTTVALWLRASRAYVTDTALMRDAVG